MVTILDGSVSSSVGHLFNLCLLARQILTDKSHSVRNTTKCYCYTSEGRSQVVVCKMYNMTQLQMCNNCYSMIFHLWFLFVPFPITKWSEVVAGMLRVARQSFQWVPGKVRSDIVVTVGGGRQGQQLQPSLFWVWSVLRAFRGVDGLCCTPDSAAFRSKLKQTPPNVYIHH